MLKKKMILVLATLVALAAACAPLKQVLRGVDDAAQVLCERHFMKAPPAGTATDGEGLKRAAEEYCKVQDHLRPWIDEVLRLEADGVSPVEAEAAPNGAAGAAQ